MTPEDVGDVYNCDPLFLPLGAVNYVAFSPYIDGRTTGRHRFLCLFGDATHVVYTPLFSKPTETRVYINQGSKLGYAAWRNSVSYADPRIMWVMPRGVMPAHSQVERWQCRVAGAQIPEKLITSAQRALAEPWPS